MPGRLLTGMPAHAWLVALLLGCGSTSSTPDAAPSAADVPDATGETGAEPGDAGPTDAPAAEPDTVDAADAAMTDAAIQEVADTPDAAAETQADTQPDAPVDASDADAGIPCETAADCPEPKSSCQAAICAQAGTCLVVYAPAGTPCDDGNPCTAGDVCQAGACQPGATTCMPCQTDFDCFQYEDGNFCNGTLTCDETQTPPTCVVAPATVVQCPVADDPCSLYVCQPPNGLCVPSQAPGGTFCSDGDPCTNGDHCLGGQCQAGTNVCSCKTDPDCVAKDDGDLCNGTMVCDKSAAPYQCVHDPATIVTCSTAADWACQKNVCQPKTGQCAMVPTPGSPPCDDGDPCTPYDSCQAGECTPSANLCMCKSDADCASQDDGNLCNGTLVCDKAKAPYKCVADPATVVVCPPAGQGPCVVNACQPLTGQCALTNILEGQPCDDGEVCTLGTDCQGGVCKGGGNYCECKKDADCASKEDGNLCNGTLVCDTSEPFSPCVVDPKTVVACSTAGNSGCLKNTCQPKTGACELVLDAGTCNDGNVCTGDICGETGVCANIPFKDGYPCGPGLVCNTGICKAK